MGLDEGGVRIDNCEDSVKKMRDLNREALLRNISVQILI